MEGSVNRIDIEKVIARVLEADEIIEAVSQNLDIGALVKKLPLDDPQLLEAVGKAAISAVEVAADNSEDWLVEGVREHLDVASLIKPALDTSRVQSALTKKIAKLASARSFRERRGSEAAQGL